MDLGQDGALLVSLYSCCLAHIRHFLRAGPIVQCGDCLGDCGVVRE